MSELKLIRESVVMSDEQPKTAALFERMQTIAGRDLRELLGDQNEISCHHAAQGVVLQYCILQCLAADAQRNSWNLYDKVDGSALAPVNGEQAEHAFGAYRRNFDASPILHDFDKRHQAAVDEIVVFDRGSGCIDHLAGCKLNVIALVQHLIANCRRQREKDAIEDFFARATQRIPRELSENHPSSLNDILACVGRGGQVKGILARERSMSPYS